ARLAMLTGAVVPDSQCGFRLLRLPVWATLRFETEHFEIESEMLAGFLKSGQQVRSVPIQTIYGSETTKISILRDTLRWLRWWRRTLHRSQLETRAGALSPVRVSAADSLRQTISALGD